MQSTSALYKEILALPHSVEVQAVIGGTVYGQSAIVSMEEDGSLFCEDYPIVGSACSGELTVVLYGVASTAIGSMAQIRPQVRIADGAGRVSEWVQQGVFYVSTRSYDPVTQQLTLHCYDSMLKMEAWYTNQVATESVIGVVRNCASQIGVTLDAETDSYIAGLSLGQFANPHYSTCRELLETVGALLAGNWYFTALNVLKLYRLNTLPLETGYLVTAEGNAITFGGTRIIVGTVEGGSRTTSAGKTYLGRNVSSVDAPTRWAPISKVTVTNTEKDLKASYGNNTGREMIIECKMVESGTISSVAQRIYNALAGYAYQPYSCADALLDPAAEMGDGVTVAGMYSGIYTRKISYGAIHRCELAAPTSDEIVNEYRYLTNQERDAIRQARTTNSIGTATASVLNGTADTIGGLNLKVNGDFYSGITITIEGNTYTLLARE